MTACRPRRSRIARTLLGSVLATAALAAAGCAPTATYPRIEGSVAISNPRLAPLPELMADAIEAVRGDVATEGGARIAFNLPANTPAAVWNEVARRVDGGVPATDADIAVAHVLQVRLQMGQAEVDVVVEPATGDAGGVPGLVTLSMQQKAFRDWTITRRRDWRVPVEVPALAWQAAEPVIETLEPDVADGPAEPLANPEPAIEPASEPAIEPAAEPDAPVLGSAG